MTETDRREVRIDVGDGAIIGDLSVPAGATGVVAFAHGSGSSRHSSRNKQVAQALVDRGLATLLMDLLTVAEEQVDVQTREHRFDIDLLAARVARSVEWLEDDPSTASLPVGLFGSSTGAAAALVAAAARPESVAAVVSRGGRPDLAGDALGHVVAPTLLVVGGEDRAVIGMNKDAMQRFPDATDVSLEVVPGAGHLFEEPGALVQVAALAGDHFLATLDGV